jgi:hypothetical protein
MHALHEYISKQLADRLKARKIVVWYDPLRIFVFYRGATGWSANER